MKLMVERESDSGKKRVGEREKQRHLEGRTDEYLEEKTPLKRIDEQMDDAPEQLKYLNEVTTSN